METIVQIKFGSHLYGTSTVSSDIDIKGIYLPTAKDILLQKVKPVISLQRQKAHGEKNTSEGIDYELYSPAKFLELLAEGHTLALDMLFAPESAMITSPHIKWHEIKDIAPKLFTKEAASFVRYCKQQANKYGIKGSRLAAIKNALESLRAGENKYGSTAKLSVMIDELKKLASRNEFIHVGQYLEHNENLVEYLEICGKKALFNTSIKSARAIAERLSDEYGERARAAESNEGVDWKALSHAVRVGHEAVEFLTNHNITFPRPEAGHLVDIKLGKLPFQQVGEEIEQLLVDVESAIALSKLPESYDQAIIDNFIENLYRESILHEVR